MKQKRGGLFLVMALLSGPLPTVAQLNQNCMVSILNRSTQADANGNWQILNVPASSFRPDPRSERSAKITES